MNHTISPLEFLLTNAICFAAGAVVLVALQLAGKAVYRAEQRKPSPRFLIQIRSALGEPIN